MLHMKPYGKILSHTEINDFGIFLGLFGLVNAAEGTTPAAPTDWLRIDDFHSELEVNLLGLIELTLKLLPLLKKAKGRVVNLINAKGFMAFVGGGYNLSKWGMESFSDILRWVVRNTCMKSKNRFQMCWGKDACMFVSSILSLLILPKEQKEMKRVMVPCFGFQPPVLWAEPPGKLHWETFAYGWHAATEHMNPLHTYTRKSTVQPSQVRHFLDMLYLKFTCCLACTKLPDIGTWNMRTLDCPIRITKAYTHVLPSWSLSEFTFDNTEITNKIMYHSILLTRRKETIRSI